MKITLYKYPHPDFPDIFIYTGTTIDTKRRHQDHRKCFTSFGKRFKERFPNKDLPTPMLDELFVEDRHEANEEETIAIFKNHTWCSFEHGMNLMIPGVFERTPEQMSIDGRKGGFKHLLLHGPPPKTLESSRLGALNQSKEDKARGGYVTTQKYGCPATSEGRRKAGQTNLLTGHIQALAKRNVETGFIQELGKKQGKINAGSGHMSALGKIYGGKFGDLHKSLHYRWHVNRNIKKIGCKFCEDSTPKVAGD